MAYAVAGGEERQTFEHQRADAFALAGIGNRQTDLCCSGVPSHVGADGDDRLHGSAELCDD
jgi:hypothetical protein